MVGGRRRVVVGGRRGRVVVGGGGRVGGSRVVVGGGGRVGGGRVVVGRRRRVRGGRVVVGRRRRVRRVGGCAPSSPPGVPGSPPSSSLLPPSSSGTRPGLVVPLSSLPGPCGLSGLSPLPLGSAGIAGNEVASPGSVPAASSVAFELPSPSVSVSLSGVSRSVPSCCSRMSGTPSLSVSISGVSWTEPGSFGLVPAFTSRSLRTPSRSESSVAFVPGGRLYAAKRWSGTPSAFASGLKSEPDASGMLPSLPTRTPERLDERRVSPPPPPLPPLLSPPPPEPAPGRPALPPPPGVAPTGRVTRSPVALTPRPSRPRPRDAAVRVGASALPTRSGPGLARWMVSLSSFWREEVRPFQSATGASRAPPTRIAEIRPAEMAPANLRSRACEVRPCALALLLPML